MGHSRRHSCSQVSKLLLLMNSRILLYNGVHPLEGSNASEKMMCRSKVSVRPAEPAIFGRSEIHGILWSRSTWTDAYQQTAATSCSQRFGKPYQTITGVEKRFLSTDIGQSLWNCKFQDHYRRLYSYLTKDWVLVFYHMMFLLPVVSQCRVPHPGIKKIRAVSIRLTIPDHSTHLVY